ncbi:helix-turn-helix domain-containing protein [Paucibacter sp. TC2R-5]|uniref:DNA-3-methyladenine glycosylase 2 family protein n=1 Tax=Paucibacter sp. TC2R-5 TaxID=2893555 RepID=UPI0021E4B957|nr:DNA-3-methyladenine glycosylase 2 family protein [Paucibacter sp. TC2R-5]MCV2358941.1 helix-turn-helix domain-containing protein [Paucibacter sp. TC2R-5]
MNLDHDNCYRALASRDARFDGRFFIAVKTTGIYCRPICPARTPKSENVVFMPSAAAAQESGFRPCLRCRPEAAPDSGAWRGVSNSGVSHTVTRALALIEAGELDSADLASLCNKLGVGERQLRRLFAEHVGAAPNAVAQTRRVLLAKQLIHETRLPLTEVAFAAGFGSIRRFNEVFQQMFARPPSALRHGSAPDCSAGPQGEVSLLLRYRPPYDWPAMLGFLAARAIPGMETVQADTYTRSISLNGVQGSVAISHAAQSKALRVVVRFPNLAALPAIIARLRRMFDLAADPAVIQAQLSAACPLMAALTAARPGLRVPGNWDGFELAMRAVLGQQITVGAAIKLAGNMVRQYGEPLLDITANQLGLSYTFPSPERIAAADLSTLGMPRTRAATLSGVASALLTTPQLLDAGASLDESLAKLLALAGIGDWTAQYIAIRQQREPDAFPAGDVGLMQAIARLEGSRPSAKQLSERALAWRPWRAYAAQHLWQSLTSEAAVETPLGMDAA